MYRAFWRNFDFLALFITLALVITGGVMIYSSYETTLGSEPRTLVENTVFRQAVFTVLGLLLYGLAALVDYHVLASLYRWVYAFVLFTLMFTLASGLVSFGAKSWLRPEGSFQPSELCKVLMIVVLARCLGRDQERLESPLPFAASALMVAPLGGLIYLQPDFGTALILAITWIGMAFLAGVRWRHILMLGFLGVIAIPVAWSQMQGYMRDRILMFLFPSYDPSGASYNINQALISIGSGGWWGKGLLHGTQSQLCFLRVRHTDFIFSVLAEELGFVGAILLLGLFALLILRLVRIAVLAQDAAGRLIAAGVATMLLAQCFINLGMNANILPVTGLPLPLVSYGGSSLTATLLALGLAQSVALRHKGPELAVP